MIVADPRRRIPRTDALLADPRFSSAIEDVGLAAVKNTILAAQRLARTGEVAPESVAATALAALPTAATSLRSVINATGVVLHTNLGRAPLSAAATAAVALAAGYVDVEFDLADGLRARRGRSTLAALGLRVPGAEAAMVVNNGAAALLLATAVLGAGREVVLSRGELVEIGDGFRLPDLIASTGARIREVGTTNRTNLADFAEAIGPDTGAIVKIHPSNFRVSGYTSAVPVSDLAGLGVPVVVDIGSGLLMPDRVLPDEPDVTSTLRDGAALVTCSGDKLLGGPQAGLIFGSAELVGRLRRHPLARALRVDKLTLAALEATVTGPPTPTSTYLHADPAHLQARCHRIVDAAVRFGVDAAVVASAGAVGGGSAPGLELPGWAVAVAVPFAQALRRGDPAVVGRIENDRCLLDVRCVRPADDAIIVDAIRRARATVA
jgi:L-seryl-tRNA(Ser) seleniumtransferase